MRRPQFLHGRLGMGRSVWQKGQTGMVSSITQGARQK
jgi:hypothetical protein